MGMQKGYFKSSFSGSGDNCVEVEFDGDSVNVRNSKRPDGPKVVYTGAEWDAFIAGAKNSEFDRS